MIIIKVKSADGTTGAEVAIMGENRRLQNEFRCAIQGVVKGFLSQIQPKYEERMKADLKQILFDCIESIDHM